MMVRGTAAMAQTNPPPAQLATAGLVSFSAMMETARVHTSFATATKTAMMAQMKTLYFVVSCFLFAMLLCYAIYHMLCIIHDIKAIINVSAHSMFFEAHFYYILFVKCNII